MNNEPVPNRSDYQNNFKWLVLIVLVQLITVPAVITLFKVISERKIAAALVGFIFISVDLFIFYRLRHLKDFYALLSYWFVLAHMFIFAIPMFLARIAFWDKSFEEIKFLTFSGVEFHQISEKASMLFFCGTVFDVLVTFIKIRRAKN